MILRNSILCLHCDTEVISRHGHDMNSCECGLVFADGGSNYLRRCGEPYDYIETSIMDNGEHETRRQFIHWGVNYDKDMNRLSSTIFKPIMELESDHIQAILDTQLHISKFYKEIFKQELIYRNGKD